jgi:hypothetical protein
MSIHSTKTQKAIIILTAVKTSNLTLEDWLYTELLCETYSRAEYDEVDWQQLLLLLLLHDHQRAQSKHTASKLLDSIALGLTGVFQSFV